MNHQQGQKRARVPKHSRPINQDFWVEESPTQKSYLLVLVYMATWAHCLSIFLSLEELRPGLVELFDLLFGSLSQEQIQVLPVGLLVESLIPNPEPIGLDFEAQDFPDSHRVHVIRVELEGNHVAPFHRAEFVLIRDHLIVGWIRPL